MALTSFVEEKSITLEPIRKEAMKVIGSYSADSLQVAIENYPGVAGEVLRMSMSVLRAKIHEDTEKVEFRWKEPKSWFQLLKKEKAPRWFVKRYPVQYIERSKTKTVTFKRYAEYPRANVAIPKNQPFFVKTLGGLEVLNDNVGVI